MACSDGPQRLRRLASELERESRAIERVVVEVSEALALVAGRPLTTLEVRGAADLLHDFYTGTEKALELVATTMDGGLPEGPHWHRRLLQTMAEPIPGTRPAVLLASTAADLDEYLRFRHLFRSLYGFELSWDRLHPLLLGLASAATAVLADLGAFRELLLELSSAP